MWHHHTASSEWIAFCLLQLSLVASVVILGTHLLGIYIIWEVIRVRGMWLHAIYGRPGVTHPPNAVHHVGRGRRFCMPDCSCTYLRGLVSTQLMTDSKFMPVACETLRFGSQACDWWAGVYIYGIQLAGLRPSPPLYVHDCLIDRVPLSHSVRCPETRRRLDPVATKT